jgi:transposase
VRVKKILSDVDNLSKSEKLRMDIIEQIQKLHKAQVSVSEISRIVGRDHKTVKKYLEGDANRLCRSKVNGQLESYTDFIIKSIKSGMTQSVIARELINLGYTGTCTNARRHICRVAEINDLELSKYRRRPSQYNDRGEKNPKLDYITRKGIFNYIWMNGELTSEHRNHLWKQFPILWEIEKCVKEFRELFNKKSLPHLYLFIERYKLSGVKELKSFANGLEKDISAVENAVSSDLSSGFVEGTNSKLKMVKRTMYGRCSKQLLEAKLMYQGTC